MQTRSNPYRVLAIFTREFTSGPLVGLTHSDKILHVDLSHAKSWLDGVNKNSELGRLEYKIVSCEFHSVSK